MLFSHHLSLPPDPVTGEYPSSWCCASMASKSRSQVLGSSVQSPEGQRDASRAAHPPAQLTPLPQVVFCGELSNKWQQVTSLVSLEFVKAKSKNKAEREVVFAAPVEQEAVSIDSPSQAALGEATQVRCRNFLLQEQEKSHSDHAPQSDQDEKPAGNVLRVFVIRRCT